MATRRGLYALGVFKTHHVHLPVIVIGNVVVGGAGKTPTVIAVVNHLQSQGWHPGVVSRGHGRRSTGVVEVGHDTAPEDSGDEPSLIHMRTRVPVCVGARRAEAVTFLITRHPEVDVVVCDDGLQHWALHRDLQIVVFDDRAVGNGWLLPAGLLREPWPRRSDRGSSPDIVLHQHREDAPQTRQVSAHGSSFFHATRRLAAQAVGPSGDVMPLKDLRPGGLIAVAGIARPAVFFEMLHAAGVQPEQEIGLPDHADAGDYASLINDPARTLICTEKDAVKLFPLLDHVPMAQRPRVWAVPLEITPDPAFFTTLDERLQGIGRKA